MGGVANFVDAGTSIWLVGAWGRLRRRKLLEVVAQFLRERGLPAMLTFDKIRALWAAPVARFPLRPGAVAAVRGGRPCARLIGQTKRLRGEISSHSWWGSGVQLPRTLEQCKSHGELSASLQCRAPIKRVRVAINLLGSPVRSFRHCRVPQMIVRPLAGAGQWTGLRRSAVGCQRDDQSRAYTSPGWRSTGGVLHQCAGEAVRDLASGLAVKSGRSRALWQDRAF